MTNNEKELIKYVMKVSEELKLCKEHGYLTSKQKKEYKYLKGLIATYEK